MTPADDAQRPGQSDSGQGGSDSGQVRSGAGHSQSGQPLAVLPSPSLPKGGGAIQGIGEKVAAAFPTGTATATIPLALTPGRAGFTPPLGLTYDSGAGNGPFGLGWSLSLPSVARRTDQGVPTYQDADESDTYLLSGAEDLVPSLRREGDAWVPATRADGAFTVHPYRPRVEGGFVRIERWVHTATGETHWRTVTPDNVTSVFGSTPATRVADPDQPLRVFRWLLEETLDDRGNVIAYTYKPEDAAGIRPEDAAGIAPALAAEAARGPAVANRYLKRVRYGNQAPGARDTWHFEVVFDYGEHDQDTPGVEEVRAWSVRPDAFSVYRSGFEVRTRRLCRRVLMFHRFPELGEDPLLVRATELAYEQDAHVTLLTAVTHAGYRRGDGDADGGAYERAALPPVEFTYTRAGPDEQPRTLDPASLEHLPYGLDGGHYQWVDLDGEGIAGILTADSPSGPPGTMTGGAWRYKRNLGGGRLAPAELVAAQPSASAPTARFMDLDGDGSLHLVTLDEGLRGFQERTRGGDWEPFTSFPAAPTLRFGDAGLRAADLDGDGRADLLVTDGTLPRWHRSLGRGGFAPAEPVELPDGDGRGPVLLLAGATEAVYLADMTGDGLTDLVRVRNGEIAYWPALGHGRFGVKVTMAAPPVFDLPDRFDQARVRLVDVDGSGPTDLVYLGPDGLRWWPNLAGNAWGGERRVAGIPPLDQATWVSVADLLGDGTACIVWSSARPADAGRQVRYVRLTGGVKPFLLSSTRNNLGAETRITYAPSTRFYLEDRAAGRPWVTKLPFPVHVVERIETTDGVTGTRLVSSHRYRHGHYDRREREFRGFALVEALDTETFPEPVAPDPTVPNPTVPNPAAPELTEGEWLHAMPALTRTWYHTGAYLEGSAIARQLAAEYYAGDPDAPELPDTILPTGLDPGDEPEACRALKGLVLRREVYGLDGPDSGPLADHPYEVTEASYGLRLVQPRAGNRHAVLFPHPAETIQSTYERRAGDPRVTHELALEVDGFGVVTRAATIAYPRRVPAQPEQARLLATCTETTVVHRPDEPDWYRLGVPVSSRAYELTGLPTLGPSGLSPYPLETVRALAEAAAEVPFEATPPAGPAKRLLGHSRTLYLRDDLSGPLPLGQVESHALPFETLTLTLTPGLASAVYGDRVDAEVFAGEGRYVLQDDEDDEGNQEGTWWTPSGRLTYDPDRFLQPVELLDPFGERSTVTYDPYALLVTRATDPLGNTTAVVNDYRTLTPVEVTDPNGNRAAARLDALGMVVATAVMGKSGAGEGDTLDDPTARLEYSLDEWVNHRRPAVVHTIARETHGPGARLRHAYAYSDGLGRVVMTKAQAEPGPAPLRDADGNLLRNPDGTLLVAEVPERWAGTGRTVFDNKGNPVKQYEPFFSSTPAYEDEADLVESGVTPILRYDPLGRLIRTDHPDGTYSLVRFDAWRQEQWDANDTVLDSAWYAERTALDPADPANQPQRRAADLAAAHAATPAITHLDPLGRPFLAIADLGLEGRLETRTALDITGNPLTLTDPRGNRTIEQTYDLQSRPLREVGAETGETITLPDIAGKPVRSWTSRGFGLRRQYDALQRPTQLVVRDPDGTERLAELYVYGEDLSDAVARNLRGQLFRTYDGAGEATVERYDFKGNPLIQRRRLTRDFRNPVDWSGLGASGAEPLEDEEFTQSTEYDALNRPVRITTPDGSDTLPGYGESGLLERMDVRLRDDAAATAFVAGVEYEADGRRARIVYGSGVTTSYSYDPRSRRLAGLVTRRASDNARLQDLSYVYDPVGNLMQVTDAAQQTLFFRNAVVSPTTRYEYDALDQLRVAAGREHAGTGQSDHGDPLAALLPHPNDATAVRPYTERYSYDPAGNITQIQHVANGGSWTRHYAYEAASNRLVATSLPGDPASGPYTGAYDHDPHGNLIRMPHLAALDWDFAQRLVRVDLGGGGTAFYAYDAAGGRTRAVVERKGGLTEERIYLGGFEMFRRHAGSGALTEERSTLHAADDTGRIALVETKTVSAGMPVSDPAPAIRFQLTNHLGSACVEVDEIGALVSYEEYHPYGTTGYRSGTSTAEVSRKRYRFTGKERDEETGFTYHGARYYAPWLGMWTAPDPAGFVDGFNLYIYARSNPVNLTDPSGTDTKPTTGWLQGSPPEIKAAVTVRSDENEQLLQQYFDVEAVIWQGRKVKIKGDVEWRSDLGSYYLNFDPAEDVTDVMSTDGVPSDLPDLPPVLVYPPHGKTVVRFDKRNPHPNADPVEHGFKPRGPGANFAPGEHATGDSASKYVSASERLFGAKGFKGQRYLIDVKEAIKRGVKFIPHKEVVADVERLMREGLLHPDRVADWKLNQQVKELEALFEGDVPSSAIATKYGMGARYTAKAVGITGAIITTYELLRAGGESYQRDSLRPIAEEAVRQATGWAATGAGFGIGSALGAAAASSWAVVSTPVGAAVVSTLGVSGVALAGGLLVGAAVGYLGYLAADSLIGWMRSWF